MQRKEKIVGALKALLDSAIADSQQAAKACFTWIHKEEMEAPANDASFGCSELARRRRYRAKRHANLDRIAEKWRKWMADASLNEFCRYAAQLLGFGAGNPVSSQLFPHAKSFTPSHNPHSGMESARVRNTPKAGRDRSEKYEAMIVRVITHMNAN